MSGLLPHPGLHRQAPNTFGLNPSSHLTLGYHWLAFLNQVLRFKSLLSPQFTVKYKIDDTSKTNKNWERKTHEPENLFQSIAHLSCKFGHFLTNFF